MGNLGEVYRKRKEYLQRPQVKKEANTSEALGEVESVGLGNGCSWRDRGARPVG